jgi:hypothetical protein
MMMQQWIGIGIGVLLVGFIFFAFRQGEKVRPSGRDPNDTSAYDPADHSGGSSP